MSDMLRACRAQDLSRLGVPTGCRPEVSESIPAGLNDIEMSLPSECDTLYPLATR